MTTHREHVLYLQSHSVFQHRILRAVPQHDTYEYLQHAVNHLHASLRRQIQPPNDSLVTAALYSVVEEVTEIDGLSRQWEHGSINRCHGTPFLLFIERNYLFRLIEHYVLSEKRDPFFHPF